MEILYVIKKFSGFVKVESIGSWFFLFLNDWIFKMYLKEIFELFIYSLLFLKMMCYSKEVFLYIELGKWFRVIMIGILSVIFISL